MHGALRFFLREMVGYPARWTGLIWCCTVGALEGLNQEKAETLKR
jgi:hypothetical protein